MSDPSQLREVIRAQRYAQTQTGRTPVNATAGPREAILVPRMVVPFATPTDRLIAPANVRWAQQWIAADPARRRMFAISNANRSATRGQFPLAERAATARGWIDALGRVHPFVANTPDLARQQIQRYWAATVADVVATYQTAARWAGPGGRLIIMIMHGVEVTQTHHPPGFQVAPPTVDPSGRHLERFLLTSEIVDADIAPPASQHVTVASNLQAARTMIENYVRLLRPGQSPPPSDADLQLAFQRMRSPADAPVARFVALYEAMLQMGVALRGLGEIFLASCDVGRSPRFIDRLRSVWGVQRFVAPTVEVNADEFRGRPNRLRMYLQFDGDGERSNTVRGETELPATPHPRIYVSQ